jgi:hypothetical protein
LIEDDVDGLVDMMTADHTFYVEGERPTTGRAAMRRAWQGYFDAFPDYRVVEDEHYQRGDRIFIVGHTTGSHVPHDLEVKPGSVIWKACVRDNLVSEWIIYPATPEQRARFGL